MEYVTLLVVGVTLLVVGYIIYIVIAGVREFLKVIAINFNKGKNNDVE